VLHQYCFPHEDADILLAGVNAIVFHYTANRSVGKWDDASRHTDRSQS